MELDLGGVPFAPRGNDPSARLHALPLLSGVLEQIQRWDDDGLGVLKLVTYRLGPTQVGPLDRRLEALPPNTHWDGWCIKMLETRCPTEVVIAIGDLARAASALEYLSIHVDGPLPEVLVLSSFYSYLI